MRRPTCPPTLAKTSDRVPAIAGSPGDRYTHRSKLHFLTESQGTGGASGWYYLTKSETEDIDAIAVTLTRETNRLVVISAKQEQTGEGLAASNADRCLEPQRAKVGQMH